MKGKAIAVLSAVAITMGSMGIVAFAANSDTGSVNDFQVPVANQGSTDSTVKSVTLDTAVQTSEDESKGSCLGSAASSQGEHQDMIDIMRDNGFQDASRYMRTGDYGKMNEFMNNLSEKDYQKMIDLMRGNGYESMAQMMKSVGREGMIQMHNTMGGMHGQGAGMMDGFTSID